MSPAAGKRMINHGKEEFRNQESGVLKAGVRNQESGVRRKTAFILTSGFQILTSVFLTMSLMLCPAVVLLWPGIGMSASAGVIPADASGIPASESGIPAAPLEIIQVRHLFDIKKNAVIPSLDQPSAVAVDSQKRIWVLDGVNGRLVGFSYDGKYLTQFGKKGSGRGEFKSPLGLAIDSQDRIYVADSKNHRIQIFDDRASPLAEVYVPPDKYKSLSDPTDMALDEGRQQLVVVDNDNHRLLIFNRKPEAVHSPSPLPLSPGGRGQGVGRSFQAYKLMSDLGGVGYEDGKFRYPYALCLDKSGNIYVTDVINTRVQVFSPKGEYIRSIGEWGIEKGQFFRPQSICMDQKGRVFVGENYAKIGLVQVFDQEGNFLGVVGDSSNQKIRFQVPADLFIDQQNRLYIVQMYTSMISVYSLEK